jgi:hypothetical protein
MCLFKKLKSYKNYLKEHPFHKLLNIDLKVYGNLEKKIKRTSYYSVDPNLKSSYDAELDDLIRLHYLVISRKVTTILEFGVGKSSIVFDHALKINKNKYRNYVLKNLRRSNPFQCFSVDNNKHWISVCKRTAKTNLVKYHYSKCVTSTFNDRICTFYDHLPNICPDLIYLDGPDQFSPTGDVRGINTLHPDRLPMSADILAIEHFLLPGTLIIVDGRTANARFLKTNLQRNWYYYHSKKYDQHFFELLENPLGIYNKKQIDFCLGKKFYLRVLNSHKFK